MRRTIISAASMAKLGINASPMKPMHTISGTQASNTRTPMRRAMRPVMNSWETSAPACTTKSITPNTRTWSARCGNSSATRRACSK